MTGFRASQRSVLEYVSSEAQEDGRLQTTTAATKKGK